MVGIAEYDIAGVNSLFVRLDNNGNDYFIGFNRAVGINADQIEAVNMVTVTQTAGDHELSFLLAKLSLGQSFTINNIKGTGRSVQIEVLSVDTSSRPGVAKVRVSNSANDGPGPAPGPIPSPSPPGADSTVGAFCFSGNTSVMVQGKGTVRMDSVRIGDRVLASNGYTKVWGFLHYHEHLQAEFLQIRYQLAHGASSILEVTADHILFSQGRTIAAGDLRVGDLLEGRDGFPIEITHIDVARRYGVYAPATETGDIIVSGVRASNYVNLISSSSVDFHILSHAIVMPFRRFCSHFNCSDEKYTKEGYAERIQYFILIGAALNKWNKSFIPTVWGFIPILLVLMGYYGAKSTTRRQLKSNSPSIWYWLI